MDSRRKHITFAIHHREGSLSDHWLDYCKMRNIQFKLVNCYDSDIVSRLHDCDALLWHWQHLDYREQNFARQLIASLEKNGLKVYPDLATCWHYDDKVGQKYLLESIGAPTIPTYIFYSEKSALEWAHRTSYPKVFKLRSGTGSSNVKLVKSKNDAVYYIKRAFGRGFRSQSVADNLRERIWRVRRDKNISSTVHLLKGLARGIISNGNRNLLMRHKGYVYFQDYVSGIEYDVRVVIIKDKAFAMKRWNRKNDFRASGSGLKSYDHRDIDTRYIDTAFRLNEQLKAQSIAFDFILHDDKIKVIEISYSFKTKIFPGYWDRNLQWNNGTVNIGHAIIDNLINDFKK